MKKSLAIIATTAVLFSNIAFAASGNTQKPQHNEAMHKAMETCMANAGVKKPEMPKDAKSGERPQPPKDGQNKANKDGKGGHPKMNLTDAQKKSIDACMAKAGFEKPKDHPKSTSSK